MNLRCAIEVRRDAVHRAQAAVVRGESAWRRALVEAMLIDDRITAAEGLTEGVFVAEDSSLRLNGGAPGKPIEGSPVPSRFVPLDGYSIVAIQPNGEVSIGGRAQAAMPERIRRAQETSDAIRRVGAAFDRIRAGWVSLPTPEKHRLTDEDAARVTWTGGDNSRAAIHARMQSDHPSGVEARRIAKALTDDSEGVGAVVFDSGWHVEVDPVRISDAEGVVWYDATECGPGITHLRSLERPPLSVLVDDPSGDDVAADWSRR
jgi:hypothetical protein